MKKVFTVFVTILAVSIAFSCNPGLITSHSSTSPVAPTNIQSTSKAEEVTLTWNAVENAGAYSIYLSETENGIYKKIANQVSTTLYTEKKLSPKKTYFFKVSSINVAGEGAMSSPVSVETLDLGSLTVVVENSVVVNNYYLVKSVSNNWLSEPCVGTKTGNSIQFLSLKEGTYKLKVVSSLVDVFRYDFYAYKAGIEISDGIEKTVNVSKDSFSGSLKLRAESYKVIPELTLSKLNEYQWGPNLLTSPATPLSPKYIEDIPSGIYDVRIYLDPSYHIFHGVVIDPFEVEVVSNYN